MSSSAVLSFVGALLVAASPVLAQVELTGTYTGRLYEDYVERGPGSDLGDYTGVPLNDEGRARALLYEPTIASMVEHQCLAYSPWSGQFRPAGARIVSEIDPGTGAVVAWIIRGDYQKGAVTIWMDGRKPPSANAVFPYGGFTTGRWDGNTLVATTTHLKAGWLRRGNGIPSSDQATITAYITRHGDLLTVTTIHEDPIYLTEPHVVSRVHQFDPRQVPDGRQICNTANEVPRLEDTGVVPHYMPDRSPAADHMTRTYNVPREAAMGFAESLYPEYRRKIRSVYTPPASCERYCCGWIERQGLPGGAPNVTCIDGGFGKLIDRRTTR
jgi:hypothetical protein